MEFMKVLADAYFEKLNLYIPLLHRPTFDRQLREGLHLVDEGFGSVVLLVCANGARMSDDPRVADYGPPGLPGWNWFLQVEKARKSIFSPPQLTDLQKCVVRISDRHVSFLHYLMLFATAYVFVSRQLQLATQLLDPHRHRHTYRTGPRRAQKKDIREHAEGSGRVVQTGVLVSLLEPGSP